MRICSKKAYWKQYSLHKWGSYCEVGKNPHFFHAFFMSFSFLLCILLRMHNSLLSALFMFVFKANNNLPVKSLLLCFSRLVYWRGTREIPMHVFPRDRWSFIILVATAAFKWTDVFLKLKINQLLVQSFGDCFDSDRKLLNRSVREQLICSDINLYAPLTCILFLSLVISFIKSFLHRLPAIQS